MTRNQRAYFAAFILATGLCSAGAASLPQEVSDAVRQVRTSDGVTPRQPFYLLEQAVPRLAGDAGQRAELAALLAEAAAAADTTAAARTVLCQHLAKVAGEKEAPQLRKLLASPEAAADARIALGEAVGAPAMFESAAAYAAQAADPKPATRIAGLAALAHLYPRDAAGACTKALADADDAVAATAIQQLARLDAAALVTAIPALSPARQALALDALAERRAALARAVAAGLLNSSDEGVRAAALSALGAVGDAGSVPALAAAGAADALAQLAGPGVDDAIRAGVAAGPAESRVTLMGAAASRGLEGLTPLLVKAASDGDAIVRAAALKTLGRSGDASAYPQLVALLGGEDSEGAEGAVKSLGRRMSDRQMRLAPLLARLREPACAAAVQAAVLRMLPPLGGEDALAPVAERLASSDAAVRDAAVRALVEWPDASAVPALRQVAEDASASATHRTLAKRALERLSAAWTRHAALAYLDCGERSDATGKAGVELRVATGKPWTFADQPEGTVAFDPTEVAVEAAGLKDGVAYEAGFTWWDYDANGRVQSVWAGDRQLMPPTPLPAWRGRQQPAATSSVKIPAACVKQGKVRLRFRREAASNAVVGEVWLSESAGGAAEASGEGRQLMALPDRTDAIPQPVIKANAGAAKRVLVVTGHEYPGHPWRQTAPALAEALAQDKRLEVSLVEHPLFLAQPGLAAYDVIALNYQNHNMPAPEGALANLRRTVEGGKGLVLFHFACGAFIDWPTKTVSPDYAAIAGRVWNPKLRGHDPRGPFRVTISDKEHPITKGMADFDIEDELYTCLDGLAPIQVLATAKSKVDQKEYPMAFVLTPAKGRTFHCVLGHDLKAMNESTCALYRRGAAWAAGLEQH